MPSKIYSDKMMTITVEMTETCAYALAQFCKRIGWRTVAEHAVDNEDTQNMMYAIGMIQKALADEGFAPR